MPHTLAETALSSRAAGIPWRQIARDLGTTTDAVIAAVARYRAERAEKERDERIARQLRETSGGYLAQ